MKIKNLIPKFLKELEAMAKKKKSRAIFKINPPAAEEEIVAYEKYLGQSLPKDYIDFLRLHNGLSYPFGLSQAVLFSIKDMMPGGKWYRKIGQWKKNYKRKDRKKVLGGIVIGNYGSSQWLYLNPKNSKLIRSTKVEVVELDNLKNFFERQLIFVEHFNKYVK